MPGFLGGGQNAGQPKQPFGPQLKQALIQAAPLFSSMAAGYSSGRGPYAYLDQGIAGMQAAQKAKRDEEAAAAAAAAFGGLVPGGMGAAGMSSMGGVAPGRGSSRPGNPLDPINIAGDTMAALGKDGGTAGYRASLIGTESGGNWKAQNSEVGAGGKAGHYGRVQFGHARLQEAMNAGAIPEGTTPEQFMNSPALQIAAENWHFGDLESKLGDLVGREVNGKVMDLPALVAMGHLGGAGGARKYVESGGQYNPSDSFGTSLADYASTHGGTGGSVTMSAKGEGAAPAAADPLADPYVQKLMQVLAMPGLTDGQRGVLTFQLETRMGQLTAKPDANALPAGFRERDLLAQAGGLIPGSPEYQQFMLGNTGETRPAAFEALRLQAIEAGFPEGSPEYREFMATRGAGLAAESRAIGEQRGAAIAGAPQEVAQADETLSFIDEVRNHPGLDMGTGMSSVLNIVPGTSGYNFQNRVDQLLSGGFLTAIDQLRGMGALSNAEGQTATRAISRMDTATSKEEFLAALDDYERVVKNGREKAAGRIEGGTAVPAITPPLVGGNVTGSGVQWSVEP